MEYLFNVGVIVVIILITLVLKYFYTFKNNPKPGNGAVFTVIAFLVTFVLSLGISSMTFATSGYEYFAHSNLSYLIIGMITVIEISLFLSLLHQTVILIPKRRIKIINSEIK